MVATHSSKHPAIWKTTGVPTQAKGRSGVASTASTRRSPNPSLWRFTSVLTRVKAVCTSMQLYFWRLRRKALPMQPTDEAKFNHIEFFGEVQTNPHWRSRSSAISTAVTRRSPETIV